MSSNSKPMSKSGLLLKLAGELETLLNIFSKIKGFCSMKCSRKTLQNLQYFMQQTPDVFFIHFLHLYFFPYSKCLGLALLDYGIKGKIKMHEMKNAKYVGFLIHKI